MHLSTEDVALYYKLMWPLLLYVNQQLNLAPRGMTLEAYQKLGTADKLKVRNALYENIHLLDEFVARNPARLSADELTVVATWKRFVADSFYIERYLKNGAIFIGSKGKPPNVYLVLGLTDSVKEVFAHFMPPPIYVQAVLLPFKGRVVYDGLLSPYEIFFGGGIKGDLREIYMAAKQNRRIIETLEPEQLALPPQKPDVVVVPEWQSQVAAIVERVDKLKGHRDAPIQQEAFRLLKAGAQLAQAAVDTPDDLDGLWKAAEKTGKALERMQTTLMRAER